MVRTAAVRGRRWGLAAAVGLLLLVVAALAGDVPGRDRPGRFLSLDTDAIAGWVVPILRFAYLLFLLVALYRWLNERTAGRRRPGERKRASPLATFLALVVVAGLVILVLPNLRSTRDAIVSTTTIGSPRPASVAEDPEELVSPGATTGGWWLVAFLGGGALLYLVAAGRRDGDILADEEGGQPMPQPIEPKTVEDSPDPGGRVLAAYRRVEEASERSGLGRSPAETAASHLRRLGSATEPKPSVRLAAGFHQARYSSHPVPEETADAAEEDGRRIMRKLRG
jgi:hypothetical protein